MNTKRRIETYLVLFIMAACFLWVAPSAAQDYPKGSIQLVVPFAPGGSNDVLARAVANSWRASSKSSRWLARMELAQ